MIKVVFIARWRESLLAQKVLEGKKGYKFHPQLIRFKKYPQPLMAISAYLTYIYFEAQKRNYNFDVSKIKILKLKKIITVKKEQLEFEANHLRNKIKVRKSLLMLNNRIFTDSKIIPHPIFKVIDGDIEKWEKV